MILALMALLSPWGTPVAQAATDVRELRTAPQLRSEPGVDYMLHVTSVAGTTVTLIDVHGGVGDWVRVDPAKLPPLPAAPPKPTKDAPQWFYGEVVGWMAVPGGWRVQRAAIGADGGTDYTFVAPEGTAKGWLTYTVIPACVGCQLEEAAGLLPGAGERMGTFAEAPEIRLGQTNPVMSWQSHPDDCTALFRYRSGGLNVQAAVLSSAPFSALDDQKGADLSVADLYIAVPAPDAAVATYLLDTFRQTFRACHSPRGWPE